MEPILGLQIARVVPGLDFILEHGRLRTRLVCCRARTEPVKPTSWNWTGNICARDLPVFLGLFCSQD